MGDTPSDLGAPRLSGPSSPKSMGGVHEAQKAFMRMAARKVLGLLALSSVHMVISGGGGLGAVLFRGGSGFPYLSFVILFYSMCVFFIAFM